MKKEELDALVATIIEKKNKADDMDIIVQQILALPYGQVKKVLTDEVMAVLAKYGYTE